MTTLEAKQELCKKLNISYSDVSSGLNGLFSDDDIQGYIEEAHLLVWDYKGWEHTEGDKTLDFSAEDVSAGYFSYPEDYISGSIFLVLVEGEEYYKTTFRDLKQYEFRQGSGDKKLFAERKRRIFFNPNAITLGETADFFGKLKATDIDADTALMQFSQDEDNQENSGNLLIVQLAYSIALYGDKKKDKVGGEKEEKDAYGKLNLLWEQYAGNRMTSKSFRPQFIIPDFYGKRGNGVNDIGTFNNY